MELRTRTSVKELRAIGELPGHGRLSALNSNGAFHNTESMALLGRVFKLQTQYVFLSRITSEDFFIGCESCLRRNQIEVGPWRVPTMFCRGQRLLAREWGHSTRLCVVISVEGAISTGLFEVLDNLAGSIRTRGSGNSTTRMRACATEVKSLDGSSILRPPNDRTKGKKLIERLFAVMNMPATESVGLLQIKWSDDLPGHDHLFQIWRVAG